MTVGAEPSPEGKITASGGGGTSEKVLTIVAEMRAYGQGNEIYLSGSFGRVIDRLARRYAKTRLCIPLMDAAPPAGADYRLAADNLEVIRQPFYSASIQALRHPVAITRAYWRAVRKADAVFVRGMLPYVGLFYLICCLLCRKPCHWIVGNPIALLKSHRRSGRWMDVAGLLYAGFDRCCARVGRWLTGGAFICNGQELGDIYRSPRTTVTVSSTVTADEFCEREDTCREETIRILFVGFIRPEKGVEYLLEALGRLRTQRGWQLTLIGTFDQYQGYCQKLTDLIQKLGIEKQVHFAGHIPYGGELLRRLREADVFVLPTLSEGTPRVLVEARANSLPVVATRVGGIPTSVTDGVDGLLVPPKDAVALAEAMDRVIEDGDLRRRLIRAGMVSARHMTVDHFVELAVRTLDGECRDPACRPG